VVVAVQKHKAVQAVLVVRVAVVLAVQQQMVLQVQ